METEAMYEEFFGLSASPFVNSIPSGSLYMSPILNETLGRLNFAVNHKMFAVVTADVGCGKTTAIRRFTDSLDRNNYEVLYIANSRLSPSWFYKSMLKQLGIEPQFYRDAASRQLHRELEIIKGIQKRQVVCIVDEAHLLSKETFEEIRFLLNSKMDSENPLSLILVGQNELWDKLKLQSYAAVRQRIDIKCEIPQYDRAETARYIDCHLKYAGCTRDIFTDKAIDEIYKYSAGAARAINKACMHSLMCAAQRKEKLIDNHLVQEVIDSELP
jgi:type II secretory pathway predicted ATPase ExeA